MKITKFVCDRCGKEIKKLHRLEIYDDSQNNWIITSDNDFCEDCVKKIAEFAVKQPEERKESEENIVPDKNSSDSEKTIEQLLKEEKTTDEIVAIKNCTKTAIYTARWQMNRKNKEAEKQSEQECKEQKEKNLDIGKINALWKAGWSVHKIADEMGVEDEIIAEVVNE